MTRILIADAGSTKTKWSYIKDKAEDIVRVESPGINPAHESSASIRLIFKTVKDFLKIKNIDKVYFFGSGCATESLKKSLHNILWEEFRAENIIVESDLYGAAISLFGNSEGIACILGTGSNSGFYSKGIIEYKIPSLGFILGDEGGGVALGKSLINAVFKQNLTSNTVNLFQNEYNLSLDEIIEKVYRQPKPAPFIASFSPFLLKNIHIPEIREIVEKEFDSFFLKNIIPYKPDPEYKIGFVGSIAFNFSSILKESAQKFNLKIHKIIHDPIPELENYFISQ